MYPLLADRLLIEPLAERDAHAFAAYRQEVDVARFQGWTTDFSVADALTLINDQPAGSVPPPGEWLQLAARSRDNGVLYGDVAIHTVAEQPDTYEVGITFAPTHQGLGLAAEALQTVVDALFHQVHAHRVVAFCDTRNTSVASLLRRVRFRQESHQVDADFLKGEWTTVDGYALLATDPRSH
jgi:RimJ/RimL family protein N-acetyltransferase